MTISLADRSLAPVPAIRKIKKKKGKKRSAKVEIRVKGDANILGDGSTSVVLKGSTISKGATMTEFTALLAKLRESLPAAPLDEKTRGAIAADIQSVESEAQGAKPSLPVIEGKLKSVESIVTRTLGIGSALAPIVQRPVELGQGLSK
jgi:hypothetical protein